MSERELLHVHQLFYNELVRRNDGKAVYNVVIDNSIPLGKAKVVTEKMIDINLETGERSDAVL